MPSVPKHDFRRREQRIVEAPEFLLPQVLNPVDYDQANILADRKEPGREGLGEFRLHLPCVLIKTALLDIDVPEFERCDRAVAGSGEDRKLLKIVRIGPALLQCLRSSPDDSWNALKSRNLV
jgi:hypothetical protein